LQEDGSVQIRRYPSAVIATTTASGDYDASSRAAFKRLAGYIFGNNTRKESISMTAPVIQQPSSVEIAMTAPVLQQSESDGWTMAFIMPAAYTLETLPAPADQRVTLLEIPGRTVAALRFAGRLTEARIFSKADELTGWLTTRGYTALSAPRSAAYDPPWTIPFFRRNEVQVDLSPDSTPPARSPRE
jgi:effector-binding domain-containing protein